MKLDENNGVFIQFALFKATFEPGSQDLAIAFHYPDFTGDLRFFPH